MNSKHNIAFVVQQMTKHKKESKETKHSEKRLKRKLGKRLLKSVNGGLAQVKKKVELCKENGVSVDYVDRKTSASTLHIASILGLADVAEYLIEKGAMVDLRDNYGNTPLFYATSHNHPNVARVLVNCHANLHATNQNGQSPASLGVVNLLEQQKEKDRRKRGIDNEANVINVDSSSSENEDDAEEREIKKVRREWEREERARVERERETERDRWGDLNDEGFDWQSHMEAEYSDSEENNYSNWKDIEEDYKEMENDSWMDRIAAQARERFSQRRAMPTQKEKEEKHRQETKEREEEYRKLLEEEMQKDKEWRERVKRAAEMNNSEEDEENWVKFEDLNLQQISQKNIPWPSGPADNILGIKDNLPHTAKKQLVRAGLLRWHPDKFMQKFGARLLETEREIILEKVKEVSQSINQYSEKRLNV